MLRSRIDRFANKGDQVSTPRHDDRGELTVHFGDCRLPHPAWHELPGLPSSTIQHDHGPDLATHTAGVMHVPADGNVVSNHRMRVRMPDHHLGVVHFGCVCRAGVRMRPRRRQPDDRHPVPDGERTLPAVFYWMGNRHHNRPELPVVHD